MEFDQKLNNLEIKIKVKKQIKEIKINGITYNYIFKLSDYKFSTLNKTELIKQIIIEDDFRKKLCEIDSNFFLIIWSKNYLFCSVDHIGSYQLAYKFKNRQITISDNILRTRDNISKHSYNSILYSGYTLDNTLYEYKTLHPCEYLIYKTIILKKIFL